MDLQILRLFLVSLSIAGFLLVWGIFTGNGGMEEISNAVGRGQYPNGEAGLKTFTGWRQLDDILMTQIGFNLIGLDHRFPAGRLFLGQFLANVSVPVFIITIEGIRGGVSALALSALAWGLLSQQVTSAVAYPLYCLVLAGRAGASSTSGKRSEVSNGDAAAALLSHLLGFAFPCLMIFEPVSIGPSAKSVWVLAFVWYPIVAAMCHKGLAILIQKFCRRPFHVDGLYLGYILLGAAASVSHVYSLWTAWVNPVIAFNTLLYPVLSPHAPLDHQVLTFFQFDYLVTFVAFLTLAYYECLVVYPGRSFKVLVALIISSFVLGPGATLSIAWSTRELGIKRRQKLNKAS